MFADFRHFNCCFKDHCLLDIRTTRLANCIYHDTVEMFKLCSKTFLIDHSIHGESECLFPKDLRSCEGTFLVFGAQFGAERGHKTIGNAMSRCIKQ